MLLWVVLDIMEILGVAPSNYIYSGSNPPSCTHSPLFLLEPTLVPVMFCLLTECCTHQSGLCYDQMGLSPLCSLSLPPHQSHDLMNSTAPVPTFDWKRHYDELMDQRRKNDMLSEKNQQLVSREVLERCSVAVGMRFH